MDAGTRLGPYEILGPLGAGGMGEVYRASDTNLKRQVAIKVLPSSVTNDPDKLARFQREAEVLAALNHPNVAAIYGLERASGVSAIVMELVEGPTLADRIAAGAIPADEALPIARQIAEALEAAHEQGIIHRDLKPANVKVRDDGTVKVLDFGLAKVYAQSASGSFTADAANMIPPTITSPAMTQAGVILGTAAYMSPEQAKGKQADKRSDIWAFGCVLYEMLTGKRTFGGDDVSDVLAAILRAEPDWSALPAEISPATRTLLRDCLAKDRRQRVGDMSAALFVINHERDLADSTHAPRTVTQPAPLWRQLLPLAATVIVALAAGYAGWALKPGAPRPITRLEVVLPDGQRITGGFALSPDGAYLAYAANDRLYLRSLDHLEPTPITDDKVPPLASPRTLVFSPDSQWLAFWEASQMKKVSVRGGAPITLAELRPPPTGVTWGADDMILVSRGIEGVWRFSGAGGTAEQVIALEAGQRAHLPQLLPDGRSILFTLARTASWDEAEIVVQALGSQTRRTLVAGGTHAQYLPTGHLVYVFRNQLLSVPFDPSSLSVRGAAVPVFDEVRRAQGPLTASGALSISAAASLAYMLAGADIDYAHRSLVWVDRRGREEAIAALPATYRHPRISPDGTRAALEVADESLNVDIRVWDFSRQTWTRVTSDLAGDREPIWTPDSQRLIFTSVRTGAIALFSQAANGTGAAEQVLDLNRQNSALPAISPDGRSLLLRDNEAGSSYIARSDINTNSSDKVGTIRVGPSTPLIKTQFEELNAAVSPDNRWLAFQSNSSGVVEIYVRPFPAVETGQWLVSRGGGTEPVWGRDGKELFYRAPSGAIMQTSITTSDTWSSMAPTQLFTGTQYFLGRSMGVTRTYDVSRDGRFLMLKTADEAQREASASQRIVIVQNWFEELKRLVPR